jgi:endonuclease/exonuclease/phosphatase family metal-dependent hydrolase
MKARTLLVAALVALVACTGGTSPTSSSPSGSPPPSVPDEPVELKVATFNIEYGGEVIDFDKVVEAALLLDADVIGIEEAWGNIPELAAGMGWPYYDARTQLVSKLPLLAPPDGDATYTYVEVEPGRVVAIGNVHLPSAPYGPRLALLDRTPEAVIALEEEVRIPALEPIATPLADLAATGVPVFVVGDFNAPSHLDWVEETVGSRPQVRFPLAWPTSMLMEDLGYRDSFREIHPDPAVEPGLTWPAARPRTPDGWNPGARSLADRIDFVFAAGPAETVDSLRLGEEGSADLSVTPYPTDHRGVVSTFLVEPATPPILVSAAHRSVDAGGDVEIFFHAPDGAGTTVSILGPDGDEVASLGTEGATDGSLSFDAASWSTGAYEALLSDASGTELARSPFWIADPNAGATITVADATVGVGDPIDVSWAGAAGNRWDWLGVYEQGADPNVASYLLWEYTAATVDGSTSFGPDSEGPWPLGPGAYSVYLLEDDSYVVLAGADFTIEE